MSRRNNAVRGPSSALTDFLKSQNITFQSVARRAATQQQQPEAGPSNAQEQEGEHAEESEQQPAPSTSPRRGRRRARRTSDGNSSDELDDPPPPPAKKQKLSEAKQKAAAKKKHEEDEDEKAYTAPSMASSSSRPPIGNREQCAECEKQFTVTQYTRAADPGPGFLCHKCVKAQGVDPFKKPGAPKKKAPPADKRQLEKLQERRFPTLVSLCVDIVSQNIGDIESFGDIGSMNMDAIAKALSRNRSLTSDNAFLFYGAMNVRLTLYDVTKLSPPALSAIASLNPNLTTLRLDYCGLMTDEVLDTWSTSLPNLVSLELLGPFLVRAPAWIKFFESHPNMTTFMIVQSPRFAVECLDALLEGSGETLKYLRLQEVGKMSDEFLERLQRVSALTHLDISDPAASCSDEGVVALLEHIGNRLRFLNLTGHTELTDGVLKNGLGKHASDLQTLKLSNIPELTDDGVAELFAQSWPLVEIDLSRNAELSTRALEKLVESTHETLEELNINGWKDATLEGILSRAPMLKTLDVGWCREMNDFVTKELVENCKSLKEVRVFGCNRVSLISARYASSVRVVGIEGTIG